jgi:hypothetical protein
MRFVIGETCLSLYSKRQKALSRKNTVIRGSWLVVRCVTHGGIAKKFPRENKIDWLQRDLRNFPRLD